jgi:hypothetical protein
VKTLELTDDEFSVLEDIFYNAIEKHEKSDILNNLEMKFEIVISESIHKNEERNDKINFLG